LAAHSCQTEGEALRFVEEQDVIKSDFLLVSGAMVANVDMRPALQAHMARRAANRQAIMTVVLHSRAARSAAAAAAASDDGCLAVVDPSNQQLLRMEQGKHSGHAVLGTHLLGERNCVAVRSACLRPGECLQAYRSHAADSTFLSCCMSHNSVSALPTCPHAPPPPRPAGAGRPAPVRCLCVRPRYSGPAERQL
jgi:hypothetical protein